MRQTACCLAMLVCAVPAFAQEVLEKKPPPSIAVVRTWGDLFDQPILTLKDGSKIRVGLEAHTVLQAGVLLGYGLLQGGQYSVGGGSEPLGPLAVGLTRKDTGKRRNRAQWARDGSKARLGITQLLFTRTVVVGREGEYDLVLRAQDGSVVAATTITVTKEKAQPWLVFGIPNQEQQEELVRENGPARAHFALKNLGTAWPKCDGSCPLRSRPDEGKEIPLTEPLSHWTFDQPAPGLQLKASAKSLQLTSDKALNLSSIHDRLLLKLWINGKPYVPTGGSEQVKQAAAKEGARELRIDLDFDAKAIGAKKGDRIAVQLLYCP